MALQNDSHSQEPRRTPGSSIVKNQKSISSTKRKVPRNLNPVEQSSPNIKLPPISRDQGSHQHEHAPDYTARMENYQQHYSSKRKMSENKGIADTAYERMALKSQSKRRMVL